MIIINARFLTQPVTGVQRFAIEISKLLKIKLKDEVHFITCPGIIHNNLAKELGAEIIGVNKSHLWEQIDLYVYLLKKGKPLLISFGYTGPLFYKNQIVTIHDVAFKYFPESFSKKFAFVYNFLVPKVAKNCLHILTVSETSKKELTKEIGLPDDKITVVYNGITSIFKSLNEIKIEKDKPYILTVSSHHPRKNYKRLIEAFGRLNDNTIELYVIGNFIKNFSEERDVKPINNVKFLTDVSDKQLLAYYQNAELFVFPSLYEGFGIPVIEAMSQNLPCVISDIPVFREIGDESVIYVNPLNIDSIVHGIQEGLKLKKKIIYYPKLKEFDWEDSTEKVINVIKKFQRLNDD
mgnify:CR=1 FL=1